jgi:hypothetical protein
MLEAATQAAAEERAVLLVGYDIEACGALASTAASRGLLATALVLAPQRSPHSVASLECALGAAPVGPPPLRSAAARALEANAMADALPLFEALARLNVDVSPHADAGVANAATAQLQLPLSPTLALHVKLTDSRG